MGFIPSQNCSCLKRKIRVEATTNQACASIVGQNKELAQRYLFHYLVSKYNELRSIGHGSNQTNLSCRLLSVFQIATLDIHEQSRIAQVLDSVEHKITKSKRNGEKLRSLKTALMQDLLTGEKRVTPLLEAEQVAGSAS